MFAWWGRLSVRTKLLAGYLCTLLVTCILVAGCVQLVVARKVQGELVEKGRYVGRSLAERVGGPMGSNDLDGLQQLLDRARQDDDVVYTLVEDGQGRILARSPQAWPASQGSMGPGEIPDAPARQSRTLQTGAGRALDVAVPIPSGGVGTVRVGIASAYVRGAVREFSLLLWVLVLVLIACGSLVAGVASRAMTRPIVDLRDAVEAVRKGDLALRLPVLSEDEIGQLTVAFNRMTAELARSSAQVEAANQALDQHARGLERIVESRTAELRRANTKLELEVHERSKAERRATETAEDLAAANGDLSILQRLSAALQETLGMDDLLGLVLRTVTGLEAATMQPKAAILLVEGDRLRLAAHQGHDESFVKLHENVRRGECLCGQAAVSGELIVSPDSAHDPRHTIHVPGAAPHAHVIVPLRAAGARIGALSLYLRSAEALEPRKLDMFRTMGDQIGAAIANARTYQRARDRSLQDPLTGLANRRQLALTLEGHVSRAQRYGNPLSVVMVDIDRFKEFNDSQGHAGGDRLLVRLSRILRRESRDPDLVARYGGEEFLLLLPETGIEQAAEVAERLRAVVQRETLVTISLGVAAWSVAHPSSDDLVADADRALYEAKEAGRDRVVVAAPRSGRGGASRLRLLK